MLQIFHQFFLKNLWKSKHSIIYFITLNRVHFFQQVGWNIYIYIYMCVCVYIYIYIVCVCVCVHTRLGWKVHMMMSYLQLMLFLSTGSKNCNIDGKCVCTAKGTRLKNKPHLVTFHVNILIRLWTFPPTLIYILNRNEENSAKTNFVFLFSKK